MTHDELQNDLAKHLRVGTDRMVWTNMQLGPSGSPRPDVFTVNRSFARFRTDCYEIKVSLADLRHDVTSGKWQSYLRFGHAVWFAFPRGMAPLDLVPKECGVILRGDGWRAARKPVAQVLETLPRDAWLKLLMEGVRDEAEPKPRHMSYWEAQELARKKWGVELAELFRARGAAQSKYERATEKLEKAAEEISRDVERRKQEALDQLRRDQGDLDHAVQELGTALGLTGAIGVRDVAQAANRMRYRLRTHSIDRAIASLQDLKQELVPGATEVTA